MLSCFWFPVWLNLLFAAEVIGYTSAPTLLSSFWYWGIFFSIWDNSFMVVWKYTKWAFNIQNTNNTYWVIQ